MGVVFSDATMDTLKEAVPSTHRRISERFIHGDDIDIHLESHHLQSTAHAFAGCGRSGLLSILAERAEAPGFNLRFGTEVREPRSLAAATDLVVGAYGTHSGVREARRGNFRPSVDGPLD